jgi:hypothetical protein
MIMYKILKAMAVLTMGSGSMIGTNANAADICYVSKNNTSCSTSQLAVRSGATGKFTARIGNAGPGTVSVKTEIVRQTSSGSYPVAGGSMSCGAGLPSAPCSSRIHEYHFVNGGSSIAKYVGKLKDFKNTNNNAPSSLSGAWIKK